MLFENLAEYFVDDLIFEDTKVLFVLESPHTEEVKNGYPVAGKSGKDMSKVLFSRSEALGKLIYTQEVQGLGIINISNYPLQKSAYKESYPELELFEKIRQNPKLRRSDKLGINPLIIQIMSDFKTRLMKHKESSIILCGRFAEAAFDAEFQEGMFQKVVRVPHPSFNQWLRASNQEKIKKMLEVIR